MTAVNDHWNVVRNFGVGASGAFAAGCILCSGSQTSLWRMALAGFVGSGLFAAVGGILFRREFTFHLQPLALGCFVGTALAFGTTAFTAVAPKRAPYAQSYNSAAAMLRDVVVLKVG